MARVYLMKDGAVSDYHAGHAHEVPVETVAEKLTPFEKRFFENPPVINANEGPAGKRDEYRHVVVHVEEAETNAVFPDEGYYYLPGLTADDGRRLFGLRE